MKNKYSKEEIREKFGKYSDWISLIPDDIYDCSELLFSRGGSILHNVGDKVDYVSILLEGEAIILGNGVSGSVMNVTTLKAGSLIGEMENITNLKEYLFDAKASKDLWILNVPGKVFRKWLETDSRVCRKIVEILADKIRQSSSISVRYNSWNAETRVKYFLISHGAGTVNIKRNDIAEACGISLRTVYRVLLRLVEQGYIWIFKGKINISESQYERIQKEIEGR